MKRFIPFFLFVLASHLVLSESCYCMGRKPAQPPPAAAASPRPTEPPAGPAPKIVFDALEYDFGDVIGVEKIEYVFTFRNGGDADLTIDNVSTSCGCTAALVSDKVVPPGGKGRISTTFTLGGRQGEQSKRIYVMSNDPRQSKVTLSIKGKITPAVGVEPNRLHLRDMEGSRTRVVKIFQTTSKELSLKEPATRHGFVTACLSEEPPKDGRKQYSIEVSLKQDIEIGRHEENVTIETNSPLKPKIEIPVSIVVSGDIQALPQRIYLGSLSPGQEISRKVTLSHAKGQLFKVESVEQDNKDFTVSPECPTAPAASHEFTIKGKITSGSGSVRVKIAFHTDNQKQPLVEVLANGYIRKFTPAAPVKKEAGIGR